MGKTLAIACAALAGCASTQAVLDREPNEVHLTEDSPTEVAFCLANKNNVAPLDPGDGSKLILIKNPYGAVLQSFTVWPDGEGSRVEYRHAFGGLGTIWKQCLGIS